MTLNLKEGEYFGHNLQSTNNSFIKLSITKYIPYCALERHFHDNPYISILIRGNYYEINNVEKKIICSGDILFRPNFYAHKNIFEDYGGTCFNIELKQGWEKQFDSKLTLPENFAYFKASRCTSLYKLLVNFKRGYNEELGYELISDWLFSINMQEIPCRKNFHPWVEKVTAILNDEVDRFHSLTSLSQRIYIHPVYLARAFKENKGITVGEYQLKQKLSNALMLLLNSTLSISEISFKNGFYDDAHFIRSFKSAYSIAPHQFRILAKS